MRCVRCKSSLAVGAQGGQYCPNDCDRIPQLRTEEDSDTVAADDGLVDTQGITLPFQKLEPCCDKEEREPFFLHDQREAQHCINCGRIFA